MNISRKRSAARILAAVVLFAMTVLVGACNEGDVLVPQSDEPFLYLVLNQIATSFYQPLEWSGQQALLLTSGSPLEPPHYRTAERFEMRRASDGARFDWRTHRGLIDEPGTLSGFQMLYANYYLPQTASADGLGKEDLQPGETYELFIQTEGVVIRGTVTIPEAFSATVLNLDGQRTVVWPRVRGAAGYSVSLSTGQIELQTDTVFALPADANSIVIRALDPHLYRYTVDDRVGRAGIDNGFGVFGAMSLAQLQIR